MAQISHVFMTLAIIWVLIETIASKVWRRFFAGLIFGLVAFLIIQPLHQDYIKAHPEYVVNDENPSLT